MHTTRSESTKSFGVAAALALGTSAGLAAVPQPPINGVVVEDLVQSFVFDRVGTNYESGPFVDEDAYRGAVRSMVIRAPDNTYDFYFHFTTSEGSGALRSFDLSWPVPTSFTVAFHATDPDLPFAPQGPSAPAPGTSFTNALGIHTFWLADENGGGSLQEGVLLLDTDALAYAKTASYVVGDDVNRTQGFYSGQSTPMVTFGPAIPEPETYALMLAGLGLLMLRRRRDDVLRLGIGKLSSSQTIACSTKTSAQDKNHWREPCNAQAMRKLLVS